MKKYILIGLMFVFGLSMITEAQNLPAKKRQAIEQTMYNMDYTKALQDVNTELQTYPEDYDLNLFKAICCSAIPEHNQEAVAAYETSITKAKTDCEKNEARYYLAKHYCEMGQKAKSLEVANTILNSDGQLDDCSKEMIEKLNKSACMSKCDDTEMQNEIAKVKKEAANKEAANNQKINELSKKISDLENQVKQAVVTPQNNGKYIADPSKPISADGYYKLHFGFNKAVLDAQSKDILERFVIFLKNNPDTKVTCIGHADMVGSNEANQTISRARAMNAKDYLVSKGIAKDRVMILYKGYDEPEIMDEYLVKTQTEFKVGEELTNDFINKLDGAKKAKANYLNRRVELKATK